MPLLSFANSFYGPHMRNNYSCKMLDCHRRAAPVLHASIGVAFRQRPSKHAGILHALGGKGEFCARYGRDFSGASV